jgi:cell division protein FtsB
VRSASRKGMRGAAARRGAPLRLLAVVACLGLLGAGAAGCSTTQEKAAAQKVESEKFLKERSERQAAHKKAKAKVKHHKHQDKQKGKK